MLNTVYENCVGPSIPKPNINSFLLLYYHFTAEYFRESATPKSRSLGAKCSADSAASCADVVRVAQCTRCAPAEFCVGGAPKSNKICHTFARFLANFCALSNAEVAQSRCQLQRRLGREMC